MQDSNDNNNNNQETNHAFSAQSRLPPHPPSFLPPFLPPFLPSSFSSCRKFTIEDASFVDNRALGASGGALSAESGSEVTATDCLFSGNQANSGGAIYGTGDNTRVTVESSWFEDNEATKEGGGLRAFSLGYVRTER